MMNQGALFDLPGAHMVEFKRVKNAQRVIDFQNRTQQGAWVSTWFEPTGKHLEDIITRIEDVASVCFLYCSPYENRSAPLVYGTDRLCSVNFRPRNYTVPF